ncbi:tryptase gamma [Culex quinquefasciatus]|uniref:Phenoloxidase-activating factor 2 n=3 Tax=Culex pipiens complex TaxID=518105 RepID=B0WRU4_CULQU|nr:tryptase gamma [Culex quinquefasciatus]|eukprot:XP_001851428.1 tryptase gamma [Culex quinquefasciatus]
MMIGGRFGLWLFVGFCLLEAATGLIEENNGSDEKNFSDLDGNHLDQQNFTAVKFLKPSSPRRQPFRVVQAEREKKHLDLNLVRKKRFIGNLLNPTKKTFQNCTTPSGVKGHCKRYQHCQQLDPKEHIWKILGQLCVIENIAIGVCCPDALTEGTGPEFSARLPALGDDGYDPVDGLDGTNNIESRDGIDRPEERGCGIATKQLPKISGGRPADPGEWPWMAALIANLGQQSFCGGVLITDRHVLTAAHCVLNLKINQFLVRLGEYDFTRYNETRSRDFRVTEIRSHADFDPVSYENDIAILKLFRPSFFNSYIWPICMPPLDDLWDGYRAVVVGWGTQFFGGPHSRVLMEVAIPIWSNRDCQDVYINRIYETSICAGDYQGGKDSCQGDSGGPLMVQLPNKRWVTVGIVSWGIRCGEANHPGIYTRVGSYVQWIIENAVF